MNVFSAFRDVTAPYSAMEAWGYDRFIGAKAVKPLLPLLAATLGSVPGDASVLDVGCGGGHLLVALAETNPGLRLTGVDLSPAQVKRALGRAQQLGARLTVEQGSALDLPYVEDTFDVVLSVTSIKHWPDQVRGLSEIVRVLKPGGRFFIGEVHRGAPVDAVEEFLAVLGVPVAVRSLLSPVFRSAVFGQGWDLADAVRLTSALSATRVEVVSFRSPPIVALVGTKT